MNIKHIVKYSLMASAVALLSVGVTTVYHHNFAPTPCVQHLWHTPPQPIDTQVSLPVASDNQAALAEENAKKLQYRSLISALLVGDVEATRLALSQGVDVNRAYDNGWPPLCAAAYGGNHDCIMLLLVAGAKPEDALWRAIKLENARAVQQLLTHGAKPNSFIWHAVDSGHEEIVKLLLEHGANPNWGMKWAAYKGNLKIVKLLLEKGADPTIGIAIASWYGHEKIVQFLLEQPGINVNYIFSDDKTVLDYATENGHSHCVELIRAAGGKRLRELNHSECVSQPVIDDFCYGITGFRNEASFWLENE